MVNVQPDSLTLPTQHFRMALRALDFTPERLGKLLKGTGIDLSEVDDPEFAVPVSAIWPLFDNATAELGEDWFLDLPILWSIELHSEFGMATRFAPSFGAAIDLLSEFGHVRWPVLRTLRAKTSAGQTLTIVPIAPVSHRNWRAIVSIASLAFQTTTRAIVGKGAETIRYRLEGDEPAYAERLIALFDDNLSWGHDRTTIFVPAPLLEQVSPLANPSAFAAMLATLRTLAAQQPHLNSFAIRVSQALDGITDGRIDADEMARRMGVSRRSLERRLEREGTTFRELQSASLQERLETLLKDPSLTIEMVSERLGFHDSSSLLRACRRWFGTTPGALKRRLREEMH